MARAIVLEAEIRLRRPSQTYLIHDPDYFSSPIWTEGKPPESDHEEEWAIRRMETQASGLQADAIELGTEAGVDILRYWDGKG